MPTWTTAQIAEKVAGRLLGPGDIAITSPQTLELAQPGQLSFIGDADYIPDWNKSRASAALVQQDILIEPAPGKAIIVVDNADLAMAVVLDLFAPPPVRPPAGVHPSAVVDPTAKLGHGVAIGPGCVIGAHVTLGDHTLLHANVNILDHTTIGASCEFFPGVVIRERCSVGHRCIFHANVVIGSDGFGYRPAPGGKGLVKITHIGTVKIGSDVELGAGTCVDRGKFSATEIGDGTKLDNLCQVGHNVRIGRCCVLSGQVGLAGSCTLGDGVMMGGKAGVADHINIGSGAKIAGYAAVMTDIPPGETWGGYPAQERRAAAREIIAVRKLPTLIAKVEKFLKDTGTKL